MVLLGRVRLPVVAPFYFMGKHISTEPEVLRKVLSNVKTNGECIEYQGSVDNRGYGRIKIGGRKGKFVGIHRFVYEKLIGEIPAGLCVCHHCDNPPCINPEHLFIGTHVDNMKDMAKKGRAHKTIGEKSGVCKISKEQIESIRRDPRKQIEIAREYGLSKSHISMIKNFKTRREG